MTFRSGDIVLLPFPFTDLSATKRRPALLLKSLGEFGDWLYLPAKRNPRYAKRLPVTTQGAHSASMALRDSDFADGALPHASWVRLNRPTLLNETIMLGRLGSLKPEIAAAIHLAMCKAMECVGHAVMEPRIATYRVEGDE